jgi:DNA-binding NarL/FixJ family response regulator
MINESTDASTGEPGVLIVEPQPLLRLGLRVTLERDTGFRVVGDVADLDSAERAAEALQPAIVLLNRDATGFACTDALELIARLRRSRPSIRVVLLGSFASEPDARRALRAGTWGYLPLTIAPSALVSALQSVGHGEIALPKALVRQLTLSLSAAAAAS